MGQIELQSNQKTKLLYDFNWRRLLIYTENLDNQSLAKTTDKNISSNDSVILASNSQKLTTSSQTSQELKTDLKKSTNSNNSHSQNSQNQVWSVWFDRLNPNSQNIIFYPKVWLENKNCLNRIQDGLQFCLENENLVTYGNFNLF